MRTFNFPPSRNIELVSCAYNDKSQEFEFFTIYPDGRRNLSMGGGVSLPSDDTERARQYLARELRGLALDFYRAGYAAAKLDVRTMLDSNVPERG